MKIFCKEKDYYDYLQDFSDDIIFDRRKFIKLSSKVILREIPLQNHWDLKNLQVFALRAGYYLFFFKSTIFMNERCEDSYIQGNFDYDIEYFGQRIDYEYKGTDILIFEWYDVLVGHDRRWKPKYHDIMKDNLNNIKKGNWNQGKYRDIKKELPIPFLRDTFIPKYIPA